jgi:Lipocalin-like domain
VRIAKSIPLLHRGRDHHELSRHTVDHGDAGKLCLPGHYCGAIGEGHHRDTDACCGRYHNAGREENSGLWHQADRNAGLHEDGRFIYLFTRSDLPKIASNSRATTTPQEGAEISQGSISTYGTYTFADKTLKVKVDHSTFANWNGAEQTRTVVVTGDEMKWTNPAGSAGGVAELVLKRAPKATN